jgi:hypothetical protein
MDDAEFDEIISRASDPNLIPGIYNYCDHRCERCRFTARCLQFRENRHEEGIGRTANLSVGQAVARSLERSLDILRIIGRRIGLGLTGEQETGESSRERAVLNDEIDAEEADPTADPLVVRARDYATTTWPIVRALRPVLDVRAETALLEALDTLEWSSTSISAKVFRAVWTTAEEQLEDDDVQNDANGSVKVARLMIDEARRAWRTLMEPGQASADGVPARLVMLLDELDAGLEARFPRAMDFVRPGFDTEQTAA